MKKTLLVKGMHCKSCEIILLDELKELGVEVSEVNHQSGRVVVEFDESEVGLDLIRSKIEQMGYRVE